jgi:hypothetical protein
MNYPPRVLTETWIFLAYSNDPECREAKYNALKNINYTFGSIVVAEKYLETFSVDTYSKSA